MTRLENVASQRVAERAGFVREGVLRRYLDIDGEWRDHLAYALLADDLPGGALARVLGPILAGVIFQQIGVGAPYVVGAVLALVALALVPGTGPGSAAGAATGPR